MKLVTILLLVVTLAACNQRLFPEYFKQAEAICEDRGGVNIFTVEPVRGEVLYKVVCKNGDSINRTVKFP